MSGPNQPTGFMNALLDAEVQKKPELIAAMFTADATLDTPALKRPVTGKKAVLEFWQAYLALFSSVRTTFTTVTPGDIQSILEWKTVGTLASGTPIDYRGVTLLDFAETRVRRFKAYYDSAAFVPDFSLHLKRL